VTRARPTLTLVLVASAWRAHQRQPLCFVAVTAEGAVRSGGADGRILQHRVTAAGAVRSDCAGGNSLQHLGAAQSVVHSEGIGSRAAQQVPHSEPKQSAALGIQGDGSGGGGGGGCSGGGAPGPETLAHIPGRVAVRQLSRSLRRKARAAQDAAIGNQRVAGGLQVHPI